MSRLRPHLLALLLLTAIVVVCYLNSLGNGFVVDDESLIVNNQMIHDLRNLPILVSRAYFDQSATMSYRPVLTLSYLLDYQIWGLRPVGFHATNLLLHLVTTLLVYTLFARLLGARMAALGGAALFAAHPVLTNAVNNLSNRSDLLATAGVLTAICCLLWSEDRPGRGRGLSVAAGAGAYALALLAKESAVVLPLLLVAIDWAQGRFDQRGWRERLLLYGGLAAITTGYLVLRFVVMVNPLEQTRLLTPFDVRVAVWPFATWTHLRLLVLPTNLMADYAFRPPAGLMDPMVVFPVAMLVCILLGLIWLWIRNQRLACLGVLWVFVALAPVANVVQNFSQPVAERYLYLPAVGFALLLTVALMRLRSRAVALGVAGTVLVLYGTLTVEQNPVWRDNVSLWLDTLQKAPESSSAHQIIGFEYERRGHLTHALHHYAWAVSLSPRYLSAHEHLGRLYLMQGRLVLAERQFHEVLRLSPNNPAVLAHLGVVYQRQGRFAEAQAALAEIRRLSPLTSRGR